MNITLDNSINRLGINVNAQNTIEKNIGENKIENCNSEANGVILELSEEATQGGFVRVKESKTSSDSSLQVESLAAEETGGISTMSLAASEVQHYQTCLRTLGFYNGSQDGNPTSAILVKAIKNFQKVYGLSETGNIEDAATQNKISSVYSKYLNYSSSAGMSEIKSAFGLDSTRTSYAELIYNAMS